MGDRFEPDSPQRLIPRDLQPGIDLQFARKRATFVARFSAVFQAKIGDHRRQETQIAHPLRNGWGSRAEPLAPLVTRGSKFIS